MATTSPKYTSSLDDFVDARTSSNTSYQTLSLVELINEDSHLIEFPAYNVLNDYYDELKDAAVVINLSDEEYFKYRFRPKLLAYDLYNNTELGFIILILNELMSVKEFDLRQIKLISRSGLAAILTNIKSAEASFIETYNTAARGDN